MTTDDAIARMIRAKQYAGRQLHRTKIMLSLEQRQNGANSERAWTLRAHTIARHLMIIKADKIITKLEDAK